MENPIQLNDILGVLATEVHRKGEAVCFPNQTFYLKNDVWILKSDLDETEDFNEHMKSLRQKMEPALKRWSDLPSGLEVELSCEMHISQNDEVSTPWVHMDLEDMQFMTTIGAELDFDIYLLPDAESTQ